MTEVLAVVAVTPPGSDVTVYSVMGLPPSEAGAVHETTVETSLGIADTSVGAPGTVDIVTEFDATTVILSGHSAEVDRYLNILINPE